MTSSSNGDLSLGLLAQAWPSLAAWIAFGLLVEGFAGWRVPAVMDDHIRREMFRLAHAHGTLLNLLLVAAALCARLGLLHAPRAALWALRAAVLAMPLGFLLGGAWHPSVDPGPGVWLVPPAAVLLLWFAVTAAMGRKNKGVAAMPGEPAGVRIEDRGSRIEPNVETGAPTAAAGSEPPARKRPRRA